MCCKNIWIRYKYLLTIVFRCSSDKLAKKHCFQKPRGSSFDVSKPDNFRDQRNIGGNSRFTLLQLVTMKMVTTAITENFRKKIFIVPTNSLEKSPRLFVSAFRCTNLPPFRCGPEVRSSPKRPTSFALFDSKSLSVENP